MKKCEPFNNWCKWFHRTPCLPLFLQQGFHVIPMFQNRAYGEKIRNGITCNLTNKSEVMKVMKQIKPDYVLHLAGRNSVIESWTVALNI